MWEASIIKKVGGDEEGGKARSVGGNGRAERLGGGGEATILQEVVDGRKEVTGEKGAGVRVSCGLLAAEAEERPGGGDVRLVGARRAGTRVEKLAVVERLHPRTGIVPHGSNAWSYRS